MQGIKFNEQGIKGILNGSKTMTRRPIKVRTDIDKQAWIDTLIGDYSKYKVGEVLFVQEEFANMPYWGIITKDILPTGLHFAATWEHASEMTEEQSRIKIKITEMKVERLQDISEEDAKREGALKIADDRPPLPMTAWSYKYSFERDIWNKLQYQPPYDWDSNPYVFVYEFEVVK